MTTPHPFGDAPLALTHRIRRPTAFAGDEAAAPPLLLLLHGIGSDERDLLALGSRLDPRFLVVSARSPLRLEQGGYGWYRTTFTAAGPVIDPVEAERGLAMLTDFVPSVARAYGADERAIYLAGFSQGAIMSLALLLTAPELVAGAALMSGRILPGVERRIAEPRERLAEKPVIAVHGLYDPVLTIADGRAVRDLLSSLPVDLTYREYPMAHEVSADSFAQVRDWLAARLDAGVAR
jgi:phospholipase/carboxylesterase